MASTLFGKPSDEVVKHPGAFSAKSARAGKSTAEYAREKAHAGGELGHQASLAKAFATMRAQKRRAKFGGVFDAADAPAKAPRSRVKFGGQMACGGMVK